MNVTTECGYTCVFKPVSDYKKHTAAFTSPHAILSTRVQCVSC